ncbi:hypothetical protein FQZ97_785660 [compost metagenome]
MVLLCGWGGRVGQLKAGSRQRYQGLQVVEGGVVGEGYVQQLQDGASAGVVDEDWREIAVLAGLYKRRTPLGPFGRRGEQADAFAPFQFLALDPACGGSRLAVLLAVEGLVLVVNDHVSPASSCFRHDLGDYLGVGVPVTGSNVGWATVARLEGASREQLDSRARCLQFEGAGGEGGGIEGGFCLHAAMISGMRYLYKNEGVQ